jgi:hypothetical protein
MKSSFNFEDFDFSLSAGAFEIKLISPLANSLRLN